MKAPEIRSLTGIRFYAAFLVFLHHVKAIPGLEEMGSWKVAGMGNFGVTLFFVLSGFILTYNYSTTFRENLSPSTYKKFVWQRFTKIYPLHIFTLLLAIPLTLYSAGPMMRMEALPLHLTLTQAFWQSYGSFNAFNQVSWTLSCEAFFYLVLPLTLVCLQSPIHKTARLAFISAIIIGFASLLAVGVLIPMSKEWTFYWFKTFPPTRFADFFLGILIGLKFSKDGFCPPQNAVFLQFSGIILISLAVYATELTPTIFNYSWIYLPGIAVLLYGLSNQDGWLGRHLGSRPLEFLGQTSFAFYMIHHLVIRYAKGGLVHFNPALSPWMLLLIFGSTLVATQVCATLMYKIVELPAQDALRRWYPKVKPTALTGVAVQG